MTTWDVLWWLVLGYLLGWVSLWFFDKLFMRDGEVAGIRAEREIATANTELVGARELLRRVEQESQLLKSDLVAQNDQADVLRTELAVFGNERNSLNADLTTEQGRVRTLQLEIESSRKLCAERAEEIGRLEQMIIDVQQERETARHWAQAKEGEVSTLEERCEGLVADKVTADKLLASVGAKIDVALRQARSVNARLATGRPVNARERLRMTGRMRRLSTLQSTIDALAAADDARRTAPAAHPEERS